MVRNLGVAKLGGSELTIFCKGVVTLLAGAAVISRLDWGWRILHQGHSLAILGGPHHVGFSIGCLSGLRTWQQALALGHPRKSDPRQSERSQEHPRWLSVF